MKKVTYSVTLKVEAIMEDRDDPVSAFDSWDLIDGDLILDADSDESIQCRTELTGFIITDIKDIHYE